MRGCLFAGGQLIGPFVEGQLLFSLRWCSPIVPCSAAAGLLPAPHLPSARAPWGSPQHVGQPCPLPDVLSSPTCHLIPAVPVPPCSQQSRLCSPRSGEVCPRNRRWPSGMAGGEGDTTLLHVSLCGEEREDLLSRCCVLQLHHIQELHLSPTTQTFAKILCQEWVSMEGLKHEGPKLVQGCVNHSCSCRQCFLARCFFTKYGTVGEKGFLS